MFHNFIFMEEAKHENKALDELIAEYREAIDELSAMIEADEAAKQALQVDDIELTCLRYCIGHDRNMESAWTAMQSSFELRIKYQSWEYSEIEDPSDQSIYTHADTVLKYIAMHTLGPQCFDGHYVTYRQIGTIDIVGFEANIERSSNFGHLRVVLEVQSCPICREAYQAVQRPAIE